MARAPTCYRDLASLRSGLYATYVYPGISQAFLYEQLQHLQTSGKQSSVPLVYHAASACQAPVVAVAVPIKLPVSLNRVAVCDVNH